MARELRPPSTSFGAAGPPVASSRLSEVRRSAASFSSMICKEREESRGMLGWCGVVGVNRVLRGVFGGGAVRVLVQRVGRPSPPPCSRSGAALPASKSMICWEGHNVSCVTDPGTPVQWQGIVFWSGVCGVWWGMAGLASSQALSCPPQRRSWMPTAAPQAFRQKAVVREGL